MIELFKAQVEQPSVEFQRINWVIKPTTEDITQYTFVLTRSNSPQGPFDLIKELQGVFHYDDFDVNQKSGNRIFYYKIRIVSPSNEYVDYGPYYETRPPDPIALEMIRKKNVALYHGSTPAIDLEVFVRKTWGTYCPQCFDVIKKRRSTSNCSFCYNTNYAGGFFAPVKTRGLYGPSQKTVQNLGFEYHPDEIYIEFANYPILSPGDIVKQDSIKRYRVGGIRVSTRGSYVITQIAKVDEVNQNDIEYEL